MNTNATIDQAKWADVCRQFHVRSLAIFGSALRDDFDPKTSDLDFLVDFEPLPPEQHADAYFGLIEALENLAGRPVDLVERRAIQNPYFRQAIETHKELLYVVA